VKSTGTYRDLKIWSKGIEIAKAIYSISALLPDDERYGLSSQIKRCAVSIPSNIAEGWGRGHSQSFVQFLRIARGSLMELQTQIYLIRELGFIRDFDLKAIEELIIEESKMLNAFINRIKESKEKTN
jgi:four helix bundle protein